MFVFVFVCVLGGIVCFGWKEIVDWEDGFVVGGGVSIRAPVRDWMGSLQVEKTGKNQQATRTYIVWNVRYKVEGIMLESSKGQIVHCTHNVSISDSFFFLITIYLTLYMHTDFAPDFPREAIPNFHKELQHFRMMPNGKELVLETLLKFCHFESAPDSNFRDNLGAPPTMGGEGQDDGDMMVEEGDSSEHGIKSPKVGIEVQSTSGTDSKVVIKEVSTCSNGEGNKAGGESGSSGTSTPAKNADMPSENGMKKKAPKSLTYSQIRWIGKFLFLVDVCVCVCVCCMVYVYPSGFVMCILRVGDYLKGEVVKKMGRIQLKVHGGF